MKQFPDEKGMPRSQDGSEPLRGGSGAFNKILNLFVAASTEDRKPRFHALLVNAATIFRNVFNAGEYQQMKDLEAAWTLDLNLFLEYADTYLSHVWNHNLFQGKYVPVIVYFPMYKALAPELRREHTGKRAVEMDMFQIFFNRHRGEIGLVKSMDHLQCWFITAGPSVLPHIELMRKFREITHHPTSLYTSGDPVYITTHIPLDLHITYRLRNVSLLESNTGRIRPPNEFRFKLDKDGRVPFIPATHVVVGDDKLIKPMVSYKLRREIMVTAQEERWIVMSEGAVIQRLSEIAKIPVSQFRKYDFS